MERVKVTQYVYEICHRCRDKAIENKHMYTVSIEMHMIPTDCLLSCYCYIIECARCLFESLNIFFVCAHDSEGPWSLFS